MSGHQHTIANMTSRLTVSAALISLLVLSIALVGCKQFGSSGAEQVVVEKPQPTTVLGPCQHSIIKIALLQDKSGSTGQTRTPQVTIEHIDLLVKFIRPCGGEIGFGLINEQSNSSLHRLRIGPPPTGAPKEPDKNGNPFQVQRDMAEYRKVKALYDQAVQAFQSETDLHVAAFRTELASFLNAPPTARRSDFFGGIQRASLFLSENSIAWPSPPRQFLLIVGDGIDNVNSKHEPLQKTTQLILVNGSASLGALASFNPSRFENIESAIDFVTASEKPAPAPR
ncbi:MAG: hypothetical protein QOH70_1953 [Blastocatellia bacterium]|nr:hypothetical protein [Blastocatellia bacterium]